MGNVVAIIPARAGSKGIPGKNLMPFCGHPLLTWSIVQSQKANCIDSVWVSSDGDDILKISHDYGAYVIERPMQLSGDRASSESAWLHAIESIEAQGIAIDWVIGMQATSPLREAKDLELALQQVISEQLDSLLSVVEVEDFFIWRNHAGKPESINYDFHNRKPRQAIEKKYLENGSFYIFSPDLLRNTGNRLGGKVGMYIMERHKMFQIDNPTDARLCEVVMKGYQLDR
ncbi:MAG: acylneuraminate cytidylyltransferase family protein [Spirulina sp. SIO3F2]|nr:acylneuraminate cytidylyltransferase family protein [Spirulina sp. SIO3F2]